MWTPPTARRTSRTPPGAPPRTVSALSSLRRTTCRPWLPGARPMQRSTRRDPWGHRCRCRDARCRSLRTVFAPVSPPLLLPRLLRLARGVSGARLAELSLRGPHDGYQWHARPATRTRLCACPHARLVDAWLACYCLLLRVSRVACQEAPLLFSRGGVYYLLFGHTCCFCTPGAAATAWTAPHPLGPWTAAGFVDPPGSNGTASLLGAQESIVFEVPLVGGGSTWVWAGDRWNSAPDGQKGHDLQYWAPLVFNDSATPPRILPLQRFVDGFTLDVAVGST